MSNDTPATTQERLDQLERNQAQLQAEVRELRETVNDLVFHRGVHRELLSVLMSEREADAGQEVVRR